MFDAYIICGTPRTGSTLLCGLLAQAGAGHPDSFYGRAFLDEWAAAWGLPDRSTMAPADYETLYLRAAIKAGKGDSRLFGLRLMRENVSDLSSALDLVFPGLASDTDRFRQAFGRILYIHLSRAEKLAQAVSYIKAQQTGLWHVAPDGSEIERIGAPGEPRYDYDRIRAEAAKLEAYDAAWNSWFTAHGVTPHRIGYEALSRAPAAILTVLCRSLGIEPPPRERIAPGVAKLSDATNDDWMRRYRADSGA